MTTILNALNQDDIAVVDDFLTASECECMLKELDFTYWSDSAVVKYIGDENSPAF